ncbi:MAG TPA: hypothetical protein VFG39_06690 [Balneolaceae bacterium]|nr:hypothetical protein [Balneolaceae bacterium]
MLSKKAMKKDSTLAKLTPDATLSQITAEHQYAGELLTSIGLNPSAHKNQTLRSVCQQRQWSEVEVLKWLKKQHRSGYRSSTEENRKETNFGNNVDQWCEYLLDDFHAVNLELMEEIKEGLPRVHKIHGNQYVWLKNMQWHFDRFDEALVMYYEFEEKRFFPLAETLQNARGELLDGTIRKLQRCLKIADKDQSRLHTLMKNLTQNSNGFENPDGACSTLCILNQNFKSLFNALDKQFKIEQEALFPAVKTMIRAKQ